MSKKAFKLCLQIWNTCVYDFTCGRDKYCFFFNFSLLVRQIESHMHKHTYNKSIHIYRYKPHPFFNAINKKPNLSNRVKRKQAMSVKSSYPNFYFPLFLNIIYKNPTSQKNKINWINVLEDATNFNLPLSIKFLFGNCKSIGLSVFFFYL